MSYDKTNIFHKIINKEIPVDFIYESKHSICFKDINPLTKLHLLIIPKGCYIDAYEFFVTRTSEDFTRNSRDG